MSRVFHWLIGGAFLGTVFLAAVIFVKPIGVSTQFVIADAIVWDLFDSTIISEDASSKSGYASSIRRGDGCRSISLIPP
jgi:hypothetical protein